MRHRLWIWLTLLLCGLGPGARAAECPPPLPAADAAAPARDRGLLWRLTRDGHSSWLYGTLHVGKPAWRAFGPQVTRALAASDALVLEVDPGDPALAQALTEPAPVPALPPDLQARLDRAFERACVGGVALATLHPVLQATTLGLLEGRWLGLDPAYAQEHLLLQAVRGRGRGGQVVLTLETAAQQKAALVPPADADLLQTLDQALTQLEDRSGRRVLARLAQAWEQGDLEMLERYAEWCECADSAAERAFMSRLNDARNPALADGIAARHRGGRRLFAAVGALHMTGPQALPRLLAARGFRVERVPLAP